MAWIDYRKAYDIVPYSCVKECLDLFGVAENIKTLLVNSMEKPRVMLCAGNSELGEVDIKRGIFPGDSLSPIVFPLALTPLSLILRKAKAANIVFPLALTPLSLILRKAKAAYEFSGSRNKIIHLLFMDDLKLYSRNEKELDSLVQTIYIFSKDIEMEFGIEKCTMLVIEKGKIVKLI